MNNQEFVLECPIHEIPYAGICGDANCNTGLICLKCDMEPCTSSKKHELISVEEFYSRFYTKLPVTYDFKKFSELIQKYHSIDKKSLKLNVEKFHFMTSSLLDKKLNTFYKNCISRLESFKNNVQKKLDNLQREYIVAENRIDISSFEIPENFTLEETKKFFEKNIKSNRDMENMVNLVKKYSDNEKLATNQKDMETIIYSKNLSDINPNEALKDKFKAIRKSFEEGVKDIVSSVLSNKEKSLICNTNLKNFQSDPNELKYYKDITDKCQKSYTIDSVFTAFTTHDGKKLLAWGTSTFVIEVYDLNTFTQVKALTGHTQHIYIVRHFFHKKKNTDYLLSTSYERNCKVWDVKTLTCVVTVSNCHSGYYLYSALLIFDEMVDKSFIVTTAPNEYTKVWDFSGNHVKDIATTTDYTYYINSWYDSKNDKIYIINANSTDVKMYDFRSGGLYKCFKSDTSSWHMSAFIGDLKDVPYLFETDGIGYLRIWNVTTGLISKTIHATGCNLRGICLWNERYVIAASSDKSFKVFDLSNNTFTTITGHENVICSVEKIELNGLGECLITSAIDGKIKIWKK